VPSRRPGAISLIAGFAIATHLHLPRPIEDVLTISSLLGQPLLICDPTGRVAGMSDAAINLELCSIGDQLNDQVLVEGLRSALDGSTWRPSSAPEDLPSDENGFKVVAMREFVRQPISVRLIGGVRVTASHTGEVIDRGPRPARAWEALIRVAAHPAGVAHDTLTSLLWPGYSRFHRNENLRQVTLRLNDRVSAIAGERLRTLIETDGIITANPDVVAVDVWRVQSASLTAERLSAAGDHERAHRLAVRTLESEMDETAANVRLFHESDMRAMPELERIAAPLSDSIAVLTVMAASGQARSDRLRGGRSWLAARQILTRMHDPAAVAAPLSAAFRDAGMPGASRWVYEDLYLAAVQRPQSWETITGQEAQDAATSP